MGGVPSFDGFSLLGVGGQLVVISSPHLSDDAKYPRVAYLLTNILLILLAVFGLIRMIRATVREHRD